MAANDDEKLSSRLKRKYSSDQEKLRRIFFETGKLEKFEKLLPNRSFDVVKQRFVSQNSYSASV